MRVGDRSNLNFTEWQTKRYTIIIRGSRHRRSFYLRHAYADHNAPYQPDEGSWSVRADMLNRAHYEIMVSAHMIIDPSY